MAAIAHLDAARGEVPIELVPTPQGDRQDDVDNDDDGRGGHRRSVFRAPPTRPIDTNWFRQNLKLKNCKRFVLNDPDYKAKEKRLYVCCCGRTYEQHSPKTVLRDAEIPARSDWKKEKDTQKFMTNAFGELLFTGHPQKTAKYARLSIDTNMDKVIELLTKQWNMTKPKFVVIVLGGKRNLDNKRQVNSMFSNGLVEACTSKYTHGWIITDGAYTGLMYEVRDALSRNMVTPTMIGVTPWGNVADQYKLTDRRGVGRWPASHVIVPQSSKFEYSLDMNHSHFLLVDDGTVGQKVNEIHLFRRDLIKALRTYLGTKVPFVNVVFQGGVGAIETIANYVEVSRQEGTKFSSVIVKHSGKAADILALAHEKSEWTTDVEEELRKKVADTFNRKVDVAKLMELIRICVSDTELVTVYDPIRRDVNIEQDMIILNAVIQAYPFDDLEKLKLVLSWNRPDLAERILAKPGTKLEQKHFPKFCHMALRMDRPEFIELFQEYGYDLSDYLSTVRLENFYNVAGRSSPAKRLLKSVRSDSRIEESFLNIRDGLVRMCANDNDTKEARQDMHRQHSVGEEGFKGPDSKDRDSEYKLKDIARLIGRLMGTFYNPLYERGSRKGADDQTPTSEAIVDCGDLSEKNYDFEEPSRELFIWAILNDKPDVAKLFWTNLKSPMAAALTAAKLLKSMSKNTLIDYSTTQKFLKLADEFEQKARGVLDTCFENEQEATMTGDEVNEYKTEYLLLRTQILYGEATCLQLAIEGKCLDFIAHASVQSLLDRIWRGKLSVENEWWRVFLSVIAPIPLVIYPLIFFREDENLNRVEKEKTETQKHQSGSQQLDIYDIGHKLKLWERMLYFFMAPIVVYSYNVITYWIFLCLFSYVVLSEYDREIKIPEMVLIGWVGTFFLEEVRQSFRDSSYWYSLGNWSDFLALLTFAIPLPFRFIPTTLDVARYVICLSLILFYVRLLHIFSAFKQLGPLLIMIKEMTIDLIFFMLIVAVFSLAYGVTWHAILYPNSPMTIELLFAVVRASYWPMFGEVQTYLDGEMEVGSCALNNVTGQINNCSSAQIIAPILLGVYILFVSILMFNLLIALFSYRFGEMYPNTDKIWSYQRYSLIREYWRRPPGPPPLIVLFHVAEFLYWIVELLLRCILSQESNSRQRFVFPWKRKLRIVFEENETQIEKELVSWECNNAKVYIMKIINSLEDEEDINVHSKDTVMTCKMNELVHATIESMKAASRRRQSRRRGVQQWRRVTRLSSKKALGSGRTTEIA